MKAHDPLRRFLQRPTRRRFEALVAATRTRVLSAAQRVTGDRGLAEDVTQEVYMKALRDKWSPDRIRDGTAWLVKTAILIGRGKVRSESRRAAREKAHAPVPAAEEHVVEVRDALETLPDELKRSVDLRYFGGLSTGEVAEELGIPRRTVQDQLKRAHAFLRPRLAPAALAFFASTVEDASAEPLGDPSPSFRARLFKGARASGLLVAAPFLPVACLCGAAVTVAVAIGIGGGAQEPPPRTNGVAAVVPPAPPPAPAQAAGRPRLVVAIQDERGRPVKGATVRFHCADLAALEAQMSVRDPKFAYLLGGIGLGDAHTLEVFELPRQVEGHLFEASATHPTLLLWRRVEFRVERGKPARVVLFLCEPRRAKVTVTDILTGAFVRGARVADIDGAGDATTDLAGEAVLEGLGRGYVLEISAPGYRTMRVGGDRAAYDVRLLRQDSAVLHVAVRDPDGNGLPGIGLRVRPMGEKKPRLLRTDKKGNAMLELPMGWVDVVLETEEWARLCHERGFSGPNPAVSRSLRLEGSSRRVALGFLQGYAVVAGEVLSAKGEPLRRMGVTLNGPCIREALTDADGRFRLERVPPGRYSVTIGTDVANDWDYPDISVEDDVPVWRRWVVGPLVLSGRVVTDGGAPVPRARLHVSGPLGRMARADAEGRFDLAGALPGTYTVWATGVGELAAGCARVVAGRPGVVRMPRGGRVEVLADPAVLVLLKPASGGEYELTRMDREPRRSRSAPVPPGRYTLQVRDAAGTVTTRPVDVKAGETTSVTIE